MRERLALQTAPLGGDIAPGDPVALLTAPSLGLADVVIVEGTASGDLMSGPGHRRDTVLPGQSGVSVLLGRASLFGGPFSQLARARSGNAVTVTTGQGVFTYTVLGVRRPGDPLPAQLTGNQGRLTLVSAAGDGRFGALTPNSTIYVDALLKGDGQPTAPGRPGAVPQAERAMQGDPSALLPLALALPLLVGALVFTVIAFRRWGGWQTWVVGVPLVLLGLWMVSQAAVQLLPNLL
jgi:sortase A